MVRPSRIMRPLTPALAASLLLLALPAAGQSQTVTSQPATSQTATITLRGEVAASCTVAVTDRGVVLDLTDAARNVPVASVAEQCNAPAGYTVTLSTQNGSSLRNAAGTAAVSYSLTYDGAVATGTGTLVASRGVSPVGQSHDLAVSTAGGNRLQAGSYSDVITISIAGR